MNKKLFTAIFAIVIICAILAFAGCTTDDDPDVTDPGNGTDTGDTTDTNSEFTFSELSDGSYEVTGFSDDYDGSAEIVIPSEHNGKPVTTIGYDAFGGCKGLTSVTIPDSVTSIGDYAFSYCSGLTNIAIPDSVESIGKFAFVWDEMLKDITLGCGIKQIGEGAFNYCGGG